MVRTAKLLDEGHYHEEFSGWEANAIYLKLFDSYGVEISFDLLTVFQPSEEPLPCDIASKEDQATFLAAIASTSTGKDLRDSFRANYGLPISHGTALYKPSRNQS